MRIPRQRIEAFVDGFENDIDSLEREAIEDWLEVAPRQAERDDVAANLLIAADRLAKVAARLQAIEEPQPDQTGAVITLACEGETLDLSELALRTVMVAAWATFNDLSHQHDQAHQAVAWLEKEPSSVQPLNEACQLIANFLHNAVG